MNPLPLLLWRRGWGEEAISSRALVIEGPNPFLPAFDLLRDTEPTAEGNCHDDEAEPAKYAENIGAQIHLAIPTKAASGLYSIAMPKTHPVRAASLYAIRNPSLRTN